MDAPSPVSDCLLPWVNEIEPYVPGMSAEELRRRYGVSRCVKLASNENPFGPSPAALRAIAEALPEIGRYPDGGGRSLKAGLARHLGVSDESIILGNGSNEIIELVARAFLGPGCSAVVSQFSFLVYSSVVRATGARVRVAPARGLAHDLTAILGAIAPDTRVVFLANPNNPTGTIFGRDEWRDFLMRLPARAVVVVDEAYAEFAAGEGYPDSIREREGGHPILTLRTFSKAHGLAGLRIGYGVGSRDLAAALNRVRQPFNVNALAQAAALAALGDGEHVRRTLRNNREGMAYLTAELRRLRARVQASWANFLLFAIDGARQVHQRLLAKGVIVRPMAAYGLEEYLRVSVGAPQDNRFFIEKLQEVLVG